MASNVRVGFNNSNAFEDHGCLLHGVNDEMQTQTHHDSFFTPPAESLHGSSYHDVPVSYVAEHLAYPADASLKRSHDELETREQAAAKRLKAAAAKKVNSEQWDAMFERVVAYKAQHGDCLVPKRYAVDPKLGTWVETQRVQHKRLQRQIDDSGTEIVAPNKRLNQERLEKLEAIGFAWSAKNTRKLKPPPAIPMTIPSPNNTSVVATTTTMNKPKKGSPEEVASRTAAKTRLHDSQWEETFQRLLQYKEKYGNCLVPRKYEDDPKLATWVETQRVLWNRDYRENGDPKSHLALPEPTAIPGALSLNAVDHKITDQWDLPKHVGATAEDAAELAATMAEDDELARHEAAAAAVVEAAETADMAMDDATYATKLPLLHKRLTRERKDRLDAIGFVWSLRNKRIDDHWDEMFRQLVQYKEMHGDCLVPSRYEENLKLGKWVETQRYEYTKLQRAAYESPPFADEADAELSLAAAKARATNPRLTEERLRRLEAIGFEWKVKHKMKRYYDKQWDQMFERLLAFRDENGHCMVPKRFPPDMKLGTWVHTQRIQYRKLVSGGKKEPEVVLSDHATDEEFSFRLTDVRRKRLEAIGFIWSAREGDKTAEQGRITRNSYDDQWDAMFNRLKEYKDRFGDCLVSKRYKDDPKLGTWVDTQRVQYKKMKKKLAEPGSEESVDLDIPAPGKPVIGRLTDDRIHRLEELGFIWSLRDDWQKHYEELKEYKKSNGHCNVPARYVPNRRLGIWVSAQRQQYKIVQTPPELRPRRSAPLTDDRIELLNELGFTWTIRSRDSLGESWTQRLQDLREFRAIHGHCLVPSRYPPNPELGIWVGTQRTQYRLYQKAKEDGEILPGASSMNDERIQQLEDLSFVWALRGGEGKSDQEVFHSDAILEEATQVVESISQSTVETHSQQEVHIAHHHHEAGGAGVHEGIAHTEI